MELVRSAAARVKRGMAGAENEYNEDEDEHASGGEPASLGSARVGVSCESGESATCSAPANAVVQEDGGDSVVVQEDGGDSVVAGTCPAVPHLQPYLGRMRVAALLLTGPAQTTEPIDADESWLRPELDITRLKTDAPVEIRSDGEWWYLASFLSMAMFGDGCRDWAVFRLLANLCV
jgi:hypothetical protein